MTTNNCTISDLTKYLISRYFSPDKINDQKFFSSTRRMIIRMANDCTVKGKSLYEQLPENKKGIKCMSVALFELHLFKRWRMYMRMREKQGDNCQMNIVEDDYERIIGHEDDDPYWQDKAEQYRKANNEFLENDSERNEVDRDKDDPEFKDRLHKKGLELMFEGIFAKFYGPFNWKKLEEDMLIADSFDGSYNFEFTPEMVRAISRLDKFKSYTTELSEGRN